jgi:hypothetical protein
MTRAELLEYLERWGTDFEKTVLDYIDDLQGMAVAAQGDFYTFLNDFLTEILDIENGKIKKSKGSIERITRLEAAFNDFQNERVNDDIVRFAEQLMQIGGLSAEYYTGLEMAKAEQVQRGLDLLRAVIGIDENGNVVKNSNLWKLSQFEDVRREIRDYVVQSIVTQRRYKDFQNGLKTVVKGGKDTAGTFERYYRQYAYDTYNQAHEVVNTAISEDLELNYFIYQGSIIDTTRDFCRKKVGKVFHRRDAQKWRTDPDLIDKKTAATYNPLIERGRYNCRHFLQWISDEMAQQLGYDSQ